MKILNQILLIFPCKIEEQENKKKTVIPKDLPKFFFLLQILVEKFVL